MADHEIHITPHVNLTEIRDFERHLAGIQRQFDALIGSAQKITWPRGPGSASPAGSGRGPSPAQPRMSAPNQRVSPDQSMPGGSPAAVPPRPSVPNQAVNPGQSIPGAAAQEAQRRGKHPTGNQGTPGANLNTPGGLLDWMQGTYLPEAATIQEMLKGFGVSSGGKTGGRSPRTPQPSTPPLSFSFSRSLWKSPPQTLEDYQNVSNEINSRPGWSAAQKKQAMDLATQGVTPTSPAALAAQGQALKQQLQARKSTGSGKRFGQSGLSKALLDAAGVGGATELLGAFGPAALGIGAVGYGVTQMQQGWTNYRTQGTAFSALSKSIGDLGQSFNTLRNTVNKSGMNFAETMGTITQAAQTYAPYVGNLGTKGFTQAVMAPQSLAFSYGLNPVSTTQAFGQAAQIGITRTNSSRGQMTPAQWASLIANATSAGSMQGRVGQVLSSMLGVSQQIAQQISQAPNQGIIAGILTTLNKSGNAMLQGTNGATIAENLNSGIQHPGLGAAGQLWMYRAINPNNKLTWGQEQWTQAQGLSGVNPYTGLSNLSSVMKKIRQELPGGKLQGSRINGIWEPGAATSNQLINLAPMLHLQTPEQVAAVIKAFQGQSPQQMNATAALAGRFGSNTLQTLMKKGNINTFAQIANAQHVSGPNGLQALAAHVKTLHGSVSQSFYTVEKAYKALGLTHPTSAKQAQTIMHQRAVDLGKMKDILAGNVVHGPQLATSMDTLNKTIANTQKNWAKIAQHIQPLANAVSKIALALSEPGKTAAGSLTGKYSVDAMQWLFDKITGAHVNLTKPSAHPSHSPSKSSSSHHVPYPYAHPGGAFGARPTAYHPLASAQASVTLPWLSSRSAARPSAMLADFVMGNMMGVNNLPWMGSLSSNGNSNSNAYSLANWSPSAANAPGLSGGVNQWSGLITSDLNRLPGKSPLLTSNLVKAVMNAESGGNPNALSRTGATGLMQLEPMTAQGLGVNAHNPGQNLWGGITYLNQQLQHFGNIAQALSAYNAGPGAVPAQGINGATQGYVEEILNELKALNAHMSNISSLASQSTPL